MKDFQITLFTFLAFFLILSCSKEEVKDLDLDVPDCLTVVVIDSIHVEKLKTIKTKFLFEDQVYWLNTDQRHSDGPEYIVNSNCDTICYHCGECVIPDCSLYLGESNWTTIWSK